MRACNTVSASASRRQAEFGVPQWMLKIWMIIRGLSAVVILIMAGAMILLLFGVKIGF